MERSLWLGVTCICSSAAPVKGEVRCVASHASSATRSYEWPSAAITGSTIVPSVMGQRNSRIAASGPLSSSTTGAGETADAHRWRRSWSSAGEAPDCGARDWPRVGITSASSDSGAGGGTG
eukprot:scaffold31486_cov75-Phaeocystis_antarctica.AAC.2